MKGIRFFQVQEKIVLLGNGEKHYFRNEVNSYSISCDVWAPESDMFIDRWHSHKIHQDRKLVLYGEHSNSDTRH